MIRAIVLAIWLAGSTASFAQGAATTAGAVTSPQAPATVAPATQTPSATETPAASTTAQTSSPAPAPPNSPTTPDAPADPAAPAQGGSGTLSVQQQDSVRAAILSQSVGAVSNTDLDATVGAKVPDGVELHDLPAGSDASGFEGLKFVVLTDGRIVFVDPSTRVISAVLG